MEENSVGTDYLHDARDIDYYRASDYWSQPNEMFARSFENYVIAKMMQEGYHNDYLANVVTIEKFARDPERYPHLLDSEMKPVTEAFDKLFDTIETRETAKGVAMFKTEEEEGTAWAVEQATPHRSAKTFDEAHEAAKEFLNVPLENSDTHLVATVSGQTLGKMLSESAAHKSVSEEIHVLAVANVDQLFKAAIEVSQEEDRNKDPNIKSIRRYVAPFLVGDDVYSVQMLVKELARRNQGNRVYSLEAIETTKPAGKWVDSTFAVGQPTSTPQAGFLQKLRDRFEAVKPPEKPGTMFKREEIEPDDRFVTDGLTSFDQQDKPYIDRDYYHGLSGRRLKEFLKTGRIPNARQAFGGDFSIADDFSIAQGHAGDGGKVIRVKLKPNTKVEVRDPFGDDEITGAPVEDIGDSEFLVWNREVLMGEADSERMTNKASAGTIPPVAKPTILPDNLTDAEKNRVRSIDFHMEGNQRTAAHLREQTARDRANLEQHKATLTTDQIADEVRRIGGFEQTAKDLDNAKDRAEAALERNLKADELAGGVGKEIAAKMVKGEGKAWGSFTRIEGNDLKVGGHGMSGFYDKIIPDFLNKYGKQWGAKVGTAIIEAGTTTEYDGETPSPDLKEVHSLDITPSMRESVMERGQPLFKLEEEEGEPLPSEWVGKRLREVSRELPKDTQRPKLIDVSKSNETITQAAAAEFRKWEPTMKAADGSDILLHNPEEGSLAARVRHLIFNNEGKRVDIRKAQWLPMVPETLANAQLRLVDEKSGNRIFVRQYQDGTKHLVIVEPNGTVKEQLPFKGSLVTQFPDFPPSRHGNMEIDWVRGGTGTGRSQGNPVPTPDGSTRPDARHPEFREEPTQSTGEVKPPEKPGTLFKLEEEENISAPPKITAKDPVVAMQEGLKKAKTDPKWKTGLAGTFEELKAVGRVLWDKYRTEPSFDNYQKSKGQWDGARQIATFKARQQKAAFDAKFKPDVQIGMFNWIEAGGDAAKLREWAEKTEDAKLKAGYERALNLTADEVAAAEDVKKFWDEQRQYAIDNGLWINFLNNYATHVQQLDNPVVRGILHTMHFSVLCRVDN